MKILFSAQRVVVFFLSLICCFTFVNVANSQISHNGVVLGKIMDVKGSSVCCISVSLLASKDSTVINYVETTKDGVFSFKLLPKGSYFVLISTIGYKRIFKGPFLITSSQVQFDLGSLTLLDDVQNLREVSIQSQKPLVEFQQHKTVINVENSTLAIGNSALDLLKKAPGVNVQQDGSISLNGKLGVTVMLDGKPTYVSNDQLKNLLNSTAGNTIKSIELISNPSVSFDAAGSSGIINIKLKKNQNFGTNGNVVVDLGYGHFYKSNYGITLNHRVKKINFFGGYSYSNNKYLGEINIDRKNENGGNTKYFDQVSENIGVSRNLNYNGGIDLIINERNNIGFQISGFQNRWNEDLDNTILIGSGSKRVDSSIIGKSLTENKYNKTSYNLNYRSVLDTLGQELIMSLDYLRFNNSQNSKYENAFYDNVGNVRAAPFLYKNSSPAIINVLSAKIDYTFLFSGFKLETGAKSSLVKTDNDFRFHIFTGENWIQDLSRSNHFLYDENINAIYGNVGKTYSSTKVQVGLRIEQTNSKANSITENKIDHNSYLDIFPNISISHKFNEENSFEIFYNKRIDRPSYASLNPFIYFTDPYTIVQGNPYLKPQYTNSIGLNYSYKRILNVGLGYSLTRDFISNVIVAQPISNSLFQTTLNLDKQKSYTLNLNSPITLFSWWNIINNFLIYYNRIQASNISEQNYNRGKFAFNFSTIQTISINPSLKGELTGKYQSSELYGTDFNFPTYNIDLGISKSFMDNKLSLKVAISDILNISNYKTRTNLPNQDFGAFIKPETRVIRVGLGYNFGSKKKSDIQRSNSSSGEESRIKS